jgi:hypothetical protein
MTQPDLTRTQGLHPSELNDQHVTEDTGIVGSSHSTGGDCGTSMLPGTPDPPPPHPKQVDIQRPHGQFD